MDSLREPIDVRERVAFAHSLSARFCCEYGSVEVRRWNEALLTPRQPNRLVHLPAPGTAVAGQ